MTTSAVLPAQLELKPYQGATLDITGTLNSQNPDGTLGAAS